MSPQVLLRHVELDERVVDVRILGDTIAEIGPSLPTEGDQVVLDARGGALLPGLHDHHVHLLATAAARRSVQVGPAQTPDAEALATALRAAGDRTPPGGWVRAVGYHESVAGDLDRATLDRIAPDRPVRVQHRTGVRWILNSAALDALGLSSPTGWFDRADPELRERLTDRDPVDLAPLAAELARLGVTGVTDTTPWGTAAELAGFAAAVGALPQRVVATGAPALAAHTFPAPLERGPVKIVLDDVDLPDLVDLTAQIRTAHGHDRAVAIHCVTRVSLIVALAAWQDAGSRDGDRIEHGSVIPHESVAQIAELGLTVVTQPGFVAERGDQYLTDVDPDDRPHLYRCASLIDAGVAVGGSTDAPYSDPDPWAAMRAAVSRRTASGAPLGSDEAVSPAQALGLFLSDPQHPGSAPRRVRLGAPADLCLLRVPLAGALERLRAEDVAQTFVAGRAVGQTSPHATAGGG